MTLGRKRKEKVKNTVINNLTHCRLMGDLYAVEASIRDNEPVSPSFSGGIRGFISGIITEINNAARRYTAVGLSVDKSKAQLALNEFRAKHTVKELKLSENPEELRKYIDKKLIGRDKDGRKRLAFALMFAIDDRCGEYQCPEESLEVVSEILFDDPKRLGQVYAMYKNNFSRINQRWPSEFDVGFGIGSGLGGALALSLLPIGVTGALALIGYLRSRSHVKEAYRVMSPGETSSTLAFMITMLEASDRDAREELTDELLERISNVRSDAEYRWLVEGTDVPECKKKIELCDLAIDRISQIKGL